MGCDPRRLGGQCTHLGTKHHHFVTPGIAILFGGRLSSVLRDAHPSCFLHGWDSSHSDQPTVTRCDKIGEAEKTQQADIE